MPQDVKALVKPVEFISPRATIYLSGKGHPFPPGSKIMLHPEHAEAFAKAELDKPLPAPAVEKTPVADKPKAKATEN